MPNNGKICHYVDLLQNWKKITKNPSTNGDKTERNQRRYIAHTPELIHTWPKKKNGKYIISDIFTKCNVEFYCKNY